MTKAPTPTENSNKPVTTKNATKNFDYTTIVDRLTTGIWSTDSHPTGVIKPIWEIPIFPLTKETIVLFGITLKQNYPFPMV